MRKLLSLLLGACAVFTACNNEEAFDMPGAGKLSINVGVNHSTSRALITAATLPDGDEGAIGVMLTDGDGKLTDYDTYTNVKFTGATASGSQKWTGATDVLLTENPGTLYAYYPWKDGTDLSAIAIETASQTDYLYATPVTGISETKANADVVMNHVLTNINLSFADGTYAGVGNITSVSVSGDGIATGGTFNAAQETPGFVADSYTGVGDAITNTTATTLGGNAIDIMVVSNDAEKPITIAATIDDVEYTATTSAVELAKGNSYQYTLTLNSTFMSVSKVTVTPWNNVVKENLTLEKEDVEEYTDAIALVYAVDEPGEIRLVDVEDYFDFTTVERMMVDGEEITPSPTYNFTTTGEHEVVVWFKDKTTIPESAFSERIEIQNVVIPSSVTTIGNYAFWSCTGLKKIHLGKSLEKIDELAFSECTALTSVTIPDAVTEIGEAAFSVCTGLKNLVLGKNVNIIRERAFGYCAIKSVEIPESVENIEAGAFQGSVEIVEFVVDDNNSVYDSRNNCNAIMETATNTLVAGCNVTVIPQDCEIIGAKAFYINKTIKGINIPNLVTKIGEEAFSGCSGLTAITIPNSVTEIEKFAFSGCKGLTGKLVIPNSVQKIGQSAFSSCEGITEVIIPNSVTNWGKWVFNGCTGLVSASMDNGLTTIGEGAFYECTSLANVTFPNSMTTIGNDAFKKCKELKNIVLNEGLQTIGDGAFSRSGLKNMSVPNSVTSIGETAFQQSSLENIILSNGLKAIQEQTFMGCSHLSSITIPASVTEIGAYAFSMCTGLESLIIPEGVTEIGDGAFDDCRDLKEIVIPEGVTNIGNNMFYNCFCLEKVTIPSTLTSFGNNVFYSCNVLKSIISNATMAPSITNETFYDMNNIYGIVVAPQGATGYDAWMQKTKNYLGAKTWRYRENTQPENGAYYSADGKTLYVADYNYSGAVTIKNGVEKIADGAFAEWTNLTEVTIPNSVKTIAERAFAGCSGLTEMTIPNSVTSIGDDAFYQCTGLTEVTISSSVTEIGAGVFSCCSSLEKITSLNTTAPSFKSNSFYNIKRNGKLYVPAGATGYNEWLKVNNYYLGYYGWDFGE